MKRVYQMLKKYHNTLFIFSLTVSAIAVSAAMIAVFLPRNTLNSENNTIYLALSIVISIITLFSFTIMVFSRVKPTKYIFISFSNNDRLFAGKIKEELSERFKSLSKYKYIILTDDDIPYGVEINKYILSLIEKSSIFLILVSDSYTKSKNCNKELNYIINKQANDSNVSVIPIVLDDFEDLSRLGYSLKNIKSLSLIGCKESEDELKKQIDFLAMDLIKHVK